MIKSIKEFLGLCIHEFETVASGNIIGYSGFKVGNFYDCRCKKCGKMKTFNLE